MNPQSPREELEIRITALLMGELSPDEAAVLQTQIAGDAELAALHARLARALGLLREASAIPEHPAPPAPARLSDERRARLLAYFKGEAMPGPVIVKPRRDWKWAVPLGLAASLMALIGGAMYVNGFALRRASVERASGMSNPRGEEWESQPGLLRYFRTEKGERDSKEANRSYYLSNSTNDSRTASEATRQLRTADGGGHDGDGRPKLAVSGPAFVAGSNWDTPRVATHFDRSTNESLPNFRGGLASSQPAKQEHERNLGNQRQRSAADAGILYLPKVAIEASASDFNAGIKAFATAPGSESFGRVSGGWAGGNKPADPTAPASLAPNTPPAPVAITAATSATGGGSSEAMHRQLHLDVSGLKSGVTGLAAVADSEEKGAKGGDDVKSPAAEDLTNGFAGGGSKDGKRAMVLLSDSATDPAGTTMAAGTLRLTGEIAQQGSAVVAVPQPTPAPPPPAGPESVRRFTRSDNLADSQVALGRFQSELSVADAKSAAKMDSDTDGLAVEGRDKASTPSLGLARGNRSDFYDMVRREGAKGDDANGRGEAGAMDGATRADGTKIAAGRPLGENRPAEGYARFPSPAKPVAGALGDKSALSLDVVEFDGFMKQPEAFVDLNEPVDPRVGRIASWTDDDTSKVKINSAGGFLDPAQTAQAERFKDSADFGTVSGVVAGSGAATLNKTGATNWSFSGANTYTGATTLNGGTLTVNGAAAQGIPANGESDVQKTLTFNAFNASGDTVAALGGVVTKTDPRVDLELKPEPGVTADYNAPELPKGLGGGGGGGLTKAGAGTLNLASGGALASPVDAPVATSAPRGGDAVLGDAFYFNSQTPPQRPAVAGIEIEPGTKAKELTRFGQTNPMKRAADDGLPIETSPGAEQDREKQTSRELAGERDENIRSTQWMSAREREKSNAAGGKDVAKKTDAPSGQAVVAAEPAVATQSEDFIEADRRSGMRGRTADGEGGKNLAEAQKTPLIAASPVVGKLFDAKPPAVPEESAPVWNGRMHVDAVTLYATGKPGKPADSKQEEATSGPEPTVSLESLGTIASPEPLKQLNAKRRAESEGAVQLQEKRVEEIKRVEEMKFAVSNEDATEPQQRFVETFRKVQKDQAQEELKKLASPQLLKEVAAQFKAEKDVVEQLQEKRVDEAKPELKELQKVADPEPEAPKPAPSPLVPQPEVTTSANAFSTFSLNVSDVAFKLAAASLEQGKMPELATVRSEEFINAFDYRDPEPAAGAPLAFTSELARYPFAQNRDLVRLSVKTAAAGRQPGRPLNVVLLLDNSGSMERADRVRILRESLRVLATQLQPQDKLSVVTFARTPRLWADGIAGDKAGEVTARIGEITPQGGTNVAAALDLGYTTALKHYKEGSINRVVLLTDGAANLGDVNPDALKQKVETFRKQGVALDCFGIGWEGYDDTVLEALSRNGDGRYGFINSPEDAATGFAGQLAGALRVAASDVKVQVEWNPRRVTAYRQVGYAKHQLKKEQFRDNTVDAAEIGAAESGNALYVVEVNPRGTGDLATVRVRFKVPGTGDYKEHEWTVPFTQAVPPLEQASPALRLAGTASAFSEWLVASPYATEVTTDRLLGLLNGVPAIYGADPRPKKLEWMIRTAKSVSGR